MFVVKFSALILHEVSSTPPSFSIHTMHIYAMHPFMSEKRTCMELRVPHMRGMDRLQSVLSFLYYCVDLYIYLNWRGTASICDNYMKVIYSK